MILESERKLHKKKIDFQVIPFVARDGINYKQNKITKEPYGFREEALLKIAFPTKLNQKLIARLVDSTRLCAFSLALATKRIQKHCVLREYNTQQCDYM